MKTPYRLLMMAAVTLSAPAAAQTALGDWVGTLGEGPGALRVVVHIAPGSDGGLMGTLDSPDQNARGIPLAEVAASDGKLAFTVPLIRGRYDGAWHADTEQWRGIWEQGAGPTPLALSKAPPPPPLPADWQLPSDEAIGQVLAARLAQRPGQGIVVGVLGPDGRRIAESGPSGGDAFDGDTLFEIGSISKVFTALILADMANKGEVALDDPAEKYLPAGGRMPERGRKITLRDLATHTSSLPRLPTNMPYSDAADPYSDYTESLLLEFLSAHELDRDVGQRTDYSNLGVGLLGYLLGRAAGADYDTLLRERITGPLGMADTAIALSAGQQARLATPLDEYLRATKPWRLAVLAGAGGIRSTAADMLKFAQAALDPASPLGLPMRTALSVEVQTGDPRFRQALGWQVAHPEPGRTVVTHNGGTGGFRSALALEPAKGRAAVVLTNGAAEPSVTDIALHVLIGAPVAPTPPLPPAPSPVAPRTEVTLPAAELDRVTGRYEFGPGVVFRVWRDGNALRAQREGSQVGPVLPIFPEAPLSFFYKALDAQVRFTTDESGKVTGAIFTQGGQDLPGTRIAD